MSIADVWRRKAIPRLAILVQVLVFLYLLAKLLGFLEIAKSTSYSKLEKTFTISRIIIWTLLLQTMQVNFFRRETESGHIADGQHSKHMTSDSEQEILRGHMTTEWILHYRDGGQEILVVGT